MLQLSIQDYDGKSTLIPLTDGEFTIGRDEDNSICLTERNVSRRHARITARSGTVYIENIAATWGTRLNNLLMRERTEFQPGDVVQIGNYVIEVVGGAAKRDTAIKQEPSAGAPAPAPAGDRPPDTATAIVNLADIQTAISSGPSDATSIPAAEQPRLVVESDNLRGLEFRVTKSPIVVGRVPEIADLVIDHRSISKEHARLTQRGDGSWEVLDLGSANGIQVNGEPYSKSDVRSGDVLVFGHVTMRFLAAGAEAPPLQATGKSGGGGNKTLLLAAIGVLLLLAGGAVAFLAVGGSDGGDKKPTPKKVKPKAAEKASKRAKAAAVEDEPVSVEHRLGQIDKLRKGGMLSDALQIAKTAQKEHPEKAQIAVLVKTLEDEVLLSAKLDELEKTIDADAKAACDGLTDAAGQLKSGSPLKARADSLKTRSCTKYTAKLLAQCETAFERKRYRKAIEACEMVQALDEGNVTAATIIERAKAKLAGGRQKPAVRAERPSPKPRAEPKPRPRPRPKPKAEPKPKPAPKPKADDSSAMTGKEAYKAARKAALAGDKKKAVKLFNAAVSKGYKRAHGQLARLYFQLGDKAGCRKHGKRYLERYPDAGDAPQIEGMLEKCK